MHLPILSAFHNLGSTANKLAVCIGIKMVKINGECLDIAGKTIAEYLETTSYNPKRIAVELNEALVPKAQYNKTVLMDDDSVEVVSFVGGG